MMRKIYSLIGALTLLASARVWAQDVLLYSKILTNPYCDVTATLELWGGADGSVQEYVNYAMYGENPDEGNVLRVNSDERLRVVWKLSGTTTAPTLRQVYQRLVYQTDTSVSETPLIVKAAVDADGRVRTLQAGATEQSQELLLEESGAGVRWFDFSLSCNVEELLVKEVLITYSSIHFLAIPLAQKKIQIQWIRGEVESLTVNPIEVVGGTYRTTVATASGRPAEQPAWRTINLWENGQALTPDRLNIQTIGDEDGVRTESVSWTAAVGKKYQLQVVDRIGVSRSVFYPDQPSTQKPVRIAAGGPNTIAAKDDGTMWLWGGNTYGQIGNGTCAIRSMPVRASRFTGTALFAEGLYYTIAARSDGSVWGWGNDKNGSLGNGRTANSSVPVQVIGLTDVVEVSAGGGQSLALKSDGTVWAWGYNGNGQLGNGTRLDSSFPIQVKGLVGVIAVSAGYTHSLALKSDGTVWAWGNNSFSELGPAVSSAERYRSLPVRVEGLTNVVSIAAGQHYSAALKSDGTVWSWGYNGEGRLGNGTQVESSIPVRAAGLTGVTAISVGLEHSLALKNDATVWAWGANRAGKLGNGSYTDSAVPLQVGGLTGVVAVAAGAYHSVALKNDRSVWSWGQASHGELGVERDSHCLVPIYSFSLETNPPTITLRREIEGTEYTDDLWKSASSVTVDASASNDADEVNAGTWKYRVDGGAWTAEGSENDSVTITAEGDHTVVFSVADNLGNYAVKAASVKIDRTPPVIAVDAKLGVTEAGAAWTNAAPLSLTATDLSGIASFTCTAAKKRADGSYASTSAVSLTGTALVFAEEGIYRLALAAVDLAGHTTSRTQYARLDVNPPTLTVAVNGAVTASAGKSTIPLLITNATDAVTGIRTWKYALDGSTTYKWLGPTQIAGTDDWNASITIAALTLGSHTITVRCTDNAGNARDETATFTVTAP